MGITKHTQLRKEALNVLFLVAKNCKKIGEMAELMILHQDFGATLEELNKDSSPEIKSRVVDIKEFLHIALKDC